MKSLFLPVFLLGLFTAGAGAVEIQVLSPPVVANAGLKAIAAAFTKETGVTVNVRGLELLKIPQDTTAQPTDIVFVTPDLMDGLSKSGAVGSRAPLGRVNIGLAVKAGAPHPDITTVPKLVAVLKAYNGVVYSNPDSARGSLGALMIDRLLKRPEFSGVHGVISSKGNGAAGLMNGEADSALQFESEILPHKEIELVGALPEELGAFVNIDVAVGAKAPQAAEAQAFLQYVTSAKTAALWQAGGLSPQMAPKGH
ncbi:MAG: substrate-binding domain-containing protein [Alphaproteobacteria bacterium]|nr:substrate-binding domain-containing protein [Alphaproteobacteria bacterium]